MDYQEYEQVRSQVMGRGFVIAIDGPSGSGKSSVSRQVAAVLDMGYLDTGAMYRSVAWWCQYKNVDFSDESAIVACVKDVEIKVNAVPHAPRFFVGGMDVKDVIRQPSISNIVSSVSTIPAVREVLISAQRAIIEEAKASGRGIVVEGRDITTVVAPDAAVRILLTASEEVRLQRRSLDDWGSQGPDAIEASRDIVLGRDEKDMTVANFADAAPGVERIDSSDLSLHETVDAVVYTIGRKV